MLKGKPTAVTTNTRYTNETGSTNVVFSLACQVLVDEIACLGNSVMKYFCKAAYCSSIFYRLHGQPLTGDRFEKNWPTASTSSS